MTKTFAFPALMALLSSLASGPLQAADIPDTARLEVAGGTLNVIFTPGELDLPQSKVFDWVSKSAHAVAGYYGRFPVREAQITIVPVAGSGVQSGKSFGHPRARVRISLGRSATEADLEKDWMLVHELVHLAFPSMDNPHHWIEEGIATYVEPIARAKAGQLSAEKVWGDLVRGLPYGLPQTGDRGLDFTPTWGRTYWGGALFCLLADIEIRKRTQNRHGLQDALRAIVAAGGSIEASWDLRRAFKIGDAATGAPVLTELYERMRSTPVDTPLSELWRSLGVEVQGRSVTFNDEAPLAGVRRAITAGRSG
ncbi:MAG TPA: hypothetical protein VHE58_11470 [Burkholderiales bacterium]|nr:hypothetical protein [Burkholderiales bacterium]